MNAGLACLSLRRRCASARRRACDQRAINAPGRGLGIGKVFSGTRKEARRGGWRGLSRTAKTHPPCDQCTRSMGLIAPDRGIRFLGAGAIPACLIGAPMQSMDAINFADEHDHRPLAQAAAQQRQAGLPAAGRADRRRHQDRPPRRARPAAHAARTRGRAGAQLHDRGARLCRGAQARPDRFAPAPAPSSARAARACGCAAAAAPR